VIQHGSHICLIVEFQGLMVAKKILETGVLARPAGDFKAGGQRTWNPIESDFHSPNRPLRWRSARALFSQDD
jgi:hypothetical protein